MLHYCLCQGSYHLVVAVLEWPLTMTRLSRMYCPRMIHVTKNTGVATGDTTDACQGQGQATDAQQVPVG